MASVALFALSPIDLTCELDAEPMLNVVQLLTVHREFIVAILSACKQLRQVTLVLGDGNQRVASHALKVLARGVHGARVCSIYIYIYIYI